MVLHLFTFILNTHFDLEPDCIIRKPIKQRFQRYIVHTEMFSPFHARVEYNTVTLPFQTNGTECAQTHTHTQKWKHNICHIHSVHLADIKSYCTKNII